MNYLNKYLQKYFLLTIVTFLFCSVFGQAHADPKTKPGPNLVKNPGFEMGTSNWIIPANTAEVVDNAARNGTHSLYYANTDAAQYEMFSQKLDAQPGQLLQFSVWVKGQDITGKKGGAGLYVQCYDAKGKYIGGSFPRTFAGTYGWKLAKGEYSVPGNAASVSVGLYLRKDIIGKVWFDDAEVRVQEPDLVASFLQYPNYRGMVLQGDTTPWKYQVRVNAQPDWENEQVKVDTTLTDSSGKVLLQKTSDISTTDETTELTLTPPAHMPLGNYLLKQSITAPVGNIALRKEYSIAVVKEMPAVYIDTQGFTVIDGKRFFPFGLYIGSNTTDVHLQRISEGGFNTVLSYAYGNESNPEAYMDRAQKHNLKVVYSLKDMYPNMRNAPPNPFETAANYIKQMRKKPALLGWYINDEMGTEWMPQFEKMYGQIKELDPNHPAFHVLNQTGFLEQYFDVTDVLGTDPYPVGRDADLTVTHINTQDTKAAAHGAKGVWMVPQIMDWAVYHEDRKQHPPSLNEMRNQAYQAIINGATGLIFYSYNDMMYEKYPRGESTINMMLFNKRWADASSMAHEIDSIIPAVLNGSKVPLTLPADALIEASALQYKNELLIMLANPYYQEEKLTFALPKGWGIKEENQGEIKSTFSNGQATFTLPSVGSGVFRLVKN